MPLNASIDLSLKYQGFKSVNEANYLIEDRQDKEQISTCGVETSKMLT